jgi:hypothetical protein
MYVGLLAAAAVLALAGPGRAGERFVIRGDLLKALMETVL